MANVSKLKYGDNTYDIKDASARHETIDSAVTSGSANLISSGAVKTYVDNSIAALPEPMIFKGTVGTGGTITSLPAAAASNEGFTYKVISNLSTPVVAKIGDTVISNGSAWTVIPSGDEPSGTVTSVEFAEGKVDNTAGISISGTNPITSSGTVTISHANTSSQASVNNSGRTYIQDITLDTYGHVTGIASATETVVNTDANVAQTATNTNANYEVLFSGTADNTTRTEGARKYSNLTFNPSTGNLNTTQINGVTVGSSPKFTDTWRGIQNNLTSDSTSDSLSAAQGKALANGSARDNTKLPLTGGTLSNGSDDTPLYIKSSNNSGAYIGFQGSNGTSYGFYGAKSDKKPYFWDNQSRRIALLEEVPTKVSQLTNDSGYVTAAHSHSADDIYGGYLNIHPENSPILIPFINNDIAYLLKRGGSAVIKYDSAVQSIDLTSVFDASPSYCALSLTGVTTVTIELTLHKTFSWSNTIYVDFGNNGWRAKTVKFEVMNSNYSGDTWTQKFYTTTNGSGHCYAGVSHIPVGASNAGAGFNKIRFTFSAWNTTDHIRIAQLGVYNYGSSGLRETFLPRDGGTLYGAIDATDVKVNGTSLPTASHKHSFTPSGSVSSSFSGSAVTSGATGSGSRADASTPSHTHSVTAGGSVSSSFSGNEVSTGKPVGTSSAATYTTSVANGDHTHSYTPAGSVSSSFSGSAVTSGKPDTTNVTSVASSGHTHTTTSTGTASADSTNKASVAKGDHTHSVTAAGNVSSTFTGSAVTSGAGDSTNKATVAKGDHTHTVTGSVSSTFTGSAVTSGANSGSGFNALLTPTYDSTAKSLTFSTNTAAPNSHTHSVTAAGSVSSTFSSGSASATASGSQVSVSTASHTHSVTASGTVSSTFTGSAVTSGATASSSRVDASTAGHTHSVSVSGTSGGPSGTTSLPNTNHTHSVTAAGSVSSSFSGTAATIAATGTSSRTAIPNADHIHKVTATGSVSSTFTGTAVTSGSADTTNKVSVAKGDHTHSVTASGSVSSTFSGSAGTTGTAS